MDWKLELAFIPVSDVDRSIDFYVNKVGFHLDYDQRVNENLRFVQITPPGSACSIAFGEGLAPVRRARRRSRLSWRTSTRRTTSSRPAASR